MRPLLGEGDHVVVEPIAWEHIRRGDIVTYRFNDKFPTRRVIRIDRRNGMLVIRGDSIPDWPDYRVRREDVLGRAAMRIRDGVHLNRLGREWRHARRMALTMHAFVALARRAPSPAAQHVLPDRASAPAAAMSRLLRLGSFDIALVGDSAPYHALLERLFRTRLEPRRREPSDLQMSLTTTPSGNGYGASDALECRDEGDQLIIATDVIAGCLHRRTTPPHLELHIAGDHPRIVVLDHYLRIVVNAVLRQLGRIRMHAAAIDLGDATSLFVGEKGAGKTTISLHLARHGGTVLAEDQVMIRRRDDDVYLAAGSDGLMRVTAKTEAHFFPHALAVTPVAIAGVAKKEIDAHDHVACMPHREHSLRRLFFPEVGRDFSVQRLSGREALVRLATPLTPINRFADDEDRRGFLQFLAGLTRQVESYRLTLSPNLADLQRLSEFLA